MSQTCNHIAAMLFKIEAAYKLGISNPSCTSLECVWNAPTKKSGALNIKLQDMNFSKPTHSKGKGMYLNF